MTFTVDDYVQLPAVPPTHRLSYGDDPNQFGDLYLPSTPASRPVIILLHGGCWRAQYGLEPLGQLSVALIELGLAVWSLEYRRLGNGGGWPNTFLDVGCGVDFLSQIAGEHHLDLNRVLTMGHSAGGHLALWTAGRPNIPSDSELFSPQPLPIHSVVSLAGIPDLVEAARQNICIGAVQELLGGEPDDHPIRYRHGSPHALLPLKIPHIHINGEQDPTVPIDYVTQFVTTARQQDKDVRLEPVPEAAHFEVVFPASHAWPIVKQSVTNLLTLSV